jgi:hypothetical protein
MGCHTKNTEGMKIIVSAVVLCKKVLYICQRLFNNIHAITSSVYYSTLVAQ